MMKLLLLSAMVVGPCVGLEDLTDNSPSDSTPEEATPPPAGPSSQVQMVINGNAADYNSTYFTTTFFSQIKTATSSPALTYVLNNFYDGSVIVLFSLYGADAATLQAFAGEIVRQSNDPASALRAILSIIQGATVVTPVAVPRGDDDGLSDGAIAGIVIGCVVFVVIVVVLVYCLACKNDEPQGQPPPDAPYGGNDDEEMENKRPASPVDEEELENKPPKASEDEEV